MISLEALHSRVAHGCHHVLPRIASGQRSRFTSATKRKSCRTVGVSPEVRQETLQDLAHDVAAVGGVGADLARPAALLGGGGPLLAQQHVGAIDLVDRDIARLAGAIEHLALAAEVEGGGHGLHPGDGTDARHLLQQRDVLGVVDLVEQGFLFLRHVHADDEQVLAGDRHLALPYSAAWAVALTGPHFFTTGSTSLANSFRPRSETS